MPPSVLTIGNFDGVHRGHAALIRRALALCADPSARVIALTFDPHPFTRIRPEAAPPRLTTFQTRARLLKRLGATDVVRLAPTDELINLSPAEFIDRLVREYSPVAFVEGPDFHFGKGRAGNNSVLADLGRSRGFTVDVVPAVEVTLDDHTIVTSSSTMTRWLISRGRVRDASLLLDRPYELEGTVNQGDRRGRTIGFPTANIATDLLLPADGVYSAHAVLPDARQFPAAINIGTRPTFSGVERRVEAHLLNAPREGDSIAGLPEYGWPITLRFNAYLRDQVRFDSIDRLRAQLARDCRRAAETPPHQAPPLRAIPPHAEPTTGSPTAP